ncbi:hypothetical protein [Kitasatospora paranensis]|uniref:Major facilitator superfamily (MFS) profile domain-containing protein n=1 Tax=Kitasatospora paranensis TaxID=258053 RepID=A0ABW2FNC4_9ACTN
MDGVVITVVLHLELGLHDGPLTAGLTLLPWSAGPAAGSWAAGSHLVPPVRDPRPAHRHRRPRHRPGRRRPRLPRRRAGRLPVRAACRAGRGRLGTGLFTPPFFDAALRGVGPQETGSAAGLLNAVQQLGGTLGVAAVGGVHRGAGGAGTAAQHALGAAALVLVATAAAVAAMTAKPARR